MVISRNARSSNLKESPFGIFLVSEVKLHNVHQYGISRERESQHNTNFRTNFHNISVKIYSIQIQTSVIKKIFITSPRLLPSHALRADTCSLAFFVWN